MKKQTLKIAKLSALVLVASLAATIPVKSMAHDSEYINAEILVNLLPLMHTHQVYWHEDSRYYPRHIERHHKRHKTHYGHQRYERTHEPKRIVRSYDGYSDNRITNKHFK